MGCGVLSPWVSSAHSGAPALLQPSNHSLRLLSIRGLVVIAYSEHVLDLGKLLKHHDELFEGYLTVAIDVNLSDDFLPNVRRISHVVTQDRCHLAGVDGSTTVFVEELEGGSQIRR